MSASTDAAEGHGRGMCSLSYIRLVTCGANGKLVLRDADRPETTFVTASAAPPAHMTCLAVRPDGSAVVVGDAQDAKNFVKVVATILLYRLGATGSVSASQRDSLTG